MQVLRCLKMYRGSSVLTVYLHCTCTVPADRQPEQWVDLEGHADAPDGRQAVGDLWMHVRRATQAHVRVIRTFPAWSIGTGVVCSHLVLKWTPLRAPHQ